MGFWEIIMLLIKFGPLIVQLVQAILELIDRLRTEQHVGLSACQAHRRRLDNELAFLRSLPRKRRGEAVVRLRGFKCELERECERRPR